MNLVLAIILGGLFGAILYRTGASSPKKLIAMLRLENLSLMKMILFGIGLASVLLSLSGLLGFLNPDHLSVKGTNLGVLIGGLLFGIGFGTVGTCPGTCVAASGSGGYKKALGAVVGGLVGAWVFSMTYGFWKGLGLFSAWDWGKRTLFHISDEFPSVFSVGFPGLLLLGLAFLAIALLLPRGRGQRR